MRNNQHQITLDLRQPDFTTALHMQDAINAKLGDGIASAINAGTVVVNNTAGNAVEMVASLESINMTTDHRATVVVDERTGTIVMGQDVQIDTVAVAHGNLSVSISESPQVSQPNAFGSGTTTTVSRTSVKAHEQKAKFVMLRHKVSLSDLVTALNSVGATPSDLIAVLQAIKAAGALHAELKVI
jgi:flagellar P-ring protein precursor FlgI